MARYLYGDSTPSSLEVNYIELVRATIDACVEVLAAQSRIRDGELRLHEIERQARQDEELLSRFGKAMQGTVAAATRDAAADGPLARCSEAVLSATGDAVRRQIQAVHASAASDARRTEQVGAGERRRCVEALRALLLDHDLPDAETAVHVEHVPGTGYSARLGSVTPYGIELVIDLDIPADSLFAGELKVGQLADAVEIHAPARGGWLRKGTRYPRHKLGKLYVTHVSVAPTGVTFNLRSSAEPGATGFDFRFRADGAIESRQPHVDDPELRDFELADADERRLRAVCERLEEAAVNLVACRTSLSQFKVDGQELAAHPQPSLVVERLVAAMAPVVKEIRAHSIPPGELVLRRRVADDRREEIFVPERELVGKIETLPAEMRRLFDPLELTSNAAARSRPPERRGMGKALPPPDAPSPVEDEIDTIVKAVEGAPRANRAPAGSVPRGRGAPRSAPRGKGGPPAGGAKAKVKG